MRAGVLAIALAASAGSMVVWGSGEYAPAGLVRARQIPESTSLQGRLVYEGGCLYLREEPSGILVLPALPSPGTEWDARAGVLTVDGVAFKVGLPIELTTGFDSGTDGWRARDDWLHPPPNSCRPDEVVPAHKVLHRGDWMSTLPSPWYLALTPPALDEPVAAMLVEEDGCYYRDADDGTRWQPMLPYGTTTDVANYRLMPYWSLDLVLGHRAELIGGPVDVADHGVIGIDAWASPLNPECDSSNLWLVISGQSFDTR